MSDKVFIKPGKVSGTLKAYPSKSYLQRALVLGLINKNGIVINNYAASGDSDAVLNAVIQLGADVGHQGRTVKITGTDSFVSHRIDCCESGLCLRMLAPVLSLSDEEFILLGSGSLMERGNGYISEVLTQLGVKCRLQKDHLSVKGPLRSGDVCIKNPSGSQLITGLLFALSKADGNSIIKISNPVSTPYIKMTSELLNRYGAEIEFKNDNEIKIKGNRDFIQGTERIEGDWSSAAFLLVAGALCGDVSMTGLNVKSLQPDALILEYLKKAGAKVDVETDRICVSKSALKSFDSDIKDHPDLFIPLIVLAMNCEGISRIYNYKRLKHKESDRPAVIISELSKCGARITEEYDHIKVEKSVLTFGELISHNDHRLAMGFAVAGLNSPSGLVIKDHQCVNKSYPVFFKDLSKITEKNNE